MVDLVYCLINLLFWYCIIILLLYYYYISYIYYYISGDIYLSSGISLQFSFVTVSELFWCKFFETFVILLSNLLPIKLPVASAFFWITLFEVVLSAAVADCEAWSRSFWLL